MENLELEKIIEKFTNDWIFLEWEIDKVSEENFNKILKQFIFDTIIIKIFKSIIPEYKEKVKFANNEQIKWYNLCITKLYLKIEEIYWIKF